MSATALQVLNAFDAFKDTHQRKRISPQMAFVSGFRAAESLEENRLSWLDMHRSAEHDSDANEHWVTAWVSQSEVGNKGATGLFVARAPTFAQCIDKFLAGDIVRID